MNLDRLLELFPYVSRHSKPTQVALAAIVAIVTLSLKARMSPSNLVSNFSKIAKKVGSSTKDDVEYDFIIVGGGTSGCVLASRLSEDPNINVLLLEAGGSGKAVFATRLPSTFSLLFRNPHHVWQFYTEPQEKLNSRKIFWPRARLLGGCSNINALMAQYGSPGDFDEWAALTDDPSWNFDNFKKYFAKMETYQPDEAYPDIDIESRGKDGPLQIGYRSYSTSMGTDFLKACNTVGIPQTPDFVWKSMGASRIMGYLDAKLKRSSSETAYLPEKVLNRPNLKVAIHATVTKIVFENGGNQEPRAVGVEFNQKAQGATFVAKAKKEVIVSSGAVHSPQILMLSGIGPAKELEKHNIPLVRDIPAVGELVDHPSIDLNFRSTDPSSQTFKIRPSGLGDVWKLIKAMWQYFVLRSGGPLAAMPTEGVAFLRTDDPKLFPPGEFPAQIEDSTSSQDGPDIELFSSNLGWKDHGKIILPGFVLGLHACLLRPESKGRVSLSSPNPWDAPLLDPHYLSAPGDIEKVLRAVRLLTRISRAEPLASSLNNESEETCFDHGLHKASDTEVLEFIRNNLTTLYHPACTCKMGRGIAEGAVVDSNLKVFGVKGLRVCDASIFPKIVSGHTAGACYAVAEKLSDMIKAEY